MDEYRPRKSAERTSELKRDTFWMKHLQEAEEQDPGRYRQCEILHRMLIGNLLYPQRTEAKTTSSLL